jgi:hypothetical protein
MADARQARAIATRRARQAHTISTKEGWVESTRQATISTQYGYADEAVAMGAIGNVCVVHWRGPKNRERAQRERVWIDRVAAAHPGRMLVLFVVAESVPPLDDEMRRAAIEMIRTRSRDLLGVATVVEASGFRGAMVRALLTAIETALGARRFPSKFCADSATACEWLSKADALAEPRRVLELAEALRHAHGQQALHAVGG